MVVILGGLLCTLKEVPDNEGDVARRVLMFVWNEWTSAPRSGRMVRMDLDVFIVMQIQATVVIFVSEVRVLFD